MHIGNIQSSVTAGYTTRASKSDPVTFEQTRKISDKASGTDSITISEDARRVAEAAQALNEPLEGGVYPLEMYALPDWVAPYRVQVNQELGTSGNWLADNYPKMAAANEAERAEYHALIRNHYQSLLEDHGITSVPEHYNAMIANKGASEALREEFEVRVFGDERLVTLMRKLGMGPSA